jgi:hypothetical protein
MEKVKKPSNSVNWKDLEEVVEIRFEVQSKNFLGYGFNSEIIAWVT